MITREFNLVINAGTSSPLIINANQNDSGESWIFNLFQEDGTKVIPAAGEIVGLKADGHAIVNAGTVNESGQVVITETEQMTAAPGANVYEIVFDSVHGTANFILYVEKSPVDDDADFSESDISAIQQAIAMAIDSATVQAIQNGLAQESATRAAQDAQLAGDISEEATTRAAADAVLRQAIDDAAIVPAGSTVVVDNTLSIAGAAADAKKTGDAVSDLNSAIDYVSVVTGLETDISQRITYTNGRYVSSTGKNSSSNSDFAIVDFYPVDGIDKIEITLPIITSSFDISGMFLCFYTDASVDSYLSRIGCVVNGSSVGYETRKIPVPSNAKYFRSSWFSSTGDYASIHNNFSCKLIKTGSYTEDSEKIDKNASDITKIKKLVADTVSPNNETTWEGGSINGDTGEDSSNGKAIRSDYMDISVYKTLIGTVVSGYRFGWHFYDSSKQHISSASAWITSKTEIIVPSNAKYFRLNITDETSSATSDLSWKTNVTIMGYCALFAIDLIEKELNGSGDYLYTGERIRLVQPNATRKCTIETWQDFTTDVYSDLADYGLNHNQSMAYYGGYLFLLNGDNTIAVMDFANKTFLDVISTQVTSRNHQNAAQFSDIFYQSGDDFPLLFVSRCGNITSSGNEDTCLIYRITKSGSDFAFTLINTITSDITTYGNDWVIDSGNRTLTMLGYVNATYATSTDNPVKFFQWTLPSVTDILSGNTIILHEADCIARMDIPYILLQSAHANNGMIYVTGRSSGLWRIFGTDIARGIIFANVPLTSNREVEGMEVIDGKLYVVQAGTDSAANPIMILQITF